MKFSAAAFRSELFSLPWNGSERHPESLLVFLFHRMEFREFASIFVPRSGIQSCFLFHGRVQFSTEFRKFASIVVPWNGIPRVFVLRNIPEFRQKYVTIYAFNSVFFGITFSEIPNPTSILFLASLLLLASLLTLVL
jgi:hypothetical protein